MLRLFSGPESVSLIGLLEVSFAGMTTLCLCFDEILAQVLPILNGSLQIVLGMSNDAERDNSREVVDASFGATEGRAPPVRGDECKSKRKPANGGTFQDENCWRGGSMRQAC